MRWDLEELAREELEAANLSTPVDPEELVIHLDLEVLDGGLGCAGFLVGRNIYVDESLRAQRRAFAVAHEVAHYLLRRRQMPDPEWKANYLASALLLPRDDFERDLRRWGWDLLRLCAQHRHASFEAVARRIVALREARAFVFDKPLAGQSRPRWYSVPSGRRPSDEERLAAREAIASGAPVEVRAGLVGWPVIQADWHRAITVASL